MFPLQSKKLIMVGKILVHLHFTHNYTNTIDLPLPSPAGRSKVYVLQIHVSSVSPGDKYSIYPSACFSIYSSMSKIETWTRLLIYPLASVSTRVLMYLHWNGIRGPFSWLGRLSWRQLWRLGQSHNPAGQSRCGASQHASAAFSQTDCGCHLGDQMGTQQHPHPLPRYLNGPHW